MPSLAGQALDRLGEGEVVDLLHERDDVAALAAAEAVVAADGGRTWNDGDFSSWNGHSPLSEPTPRGRRVTCSRTTSSMDVRSLTVAMSSAADPSRHVHSSSLRRARRVGRRLVGRARHHRRVQARAARTSVSEATWSTTHAQRARRRRRPRPSRAAGRGRAGRGRRSTGRDEVGEHLALPAVQRRPARRRHDVGGGDPLEHRALGPRLVRDDEVGRRSGSAVRAVLARGWPARRRRRTGR